MVQFSDLIFEKLHCTNESNIGLHCRQRNTNPRVNGLMPETRFTEFPALSVDPRVGISRSASETDVRLSFLPMAFKIVIYHSSFLSFLTFYVAKRPFPNAIRCFSWWCKSDVTSEI